MSDEPYFDGDGLAEAIQQAIRTVARAITPLDAMGFEDAAGGYVSSLTEAVMGNTAALMAIAEALKSIAAEIRLHD